MGEPALYFALGFLIAVLLALVAAPTLWRRAAKVTKRQVEASLPLTLDAIEAGKDRIRAESAVAVRRLEMTAASATDKASAQMIELGSAREDVKRVEAEHEATRETLERETARASGLESRLAAQAQDLSLLEQKQADAELRLSEGARELVRIGDQYQEAAYTSGLRQIELTGRENDLRTLRDELRKAYETCAELETRHAGQDEALAAARSAASAERKRADERDDRLARNLAVLADHEDALVRGERDAATLRAALQNATKNSNEFGLQLHAAQDQIRLLEGRIAADGRQRTLRPMEYSDIVSDEASKYAADRRRLEDRLTIIAKQNQKLRAELAALQVPLTAAATGGDQDAMLREQITAIAAQVVHLAQVLEGPDSQIDKALGLPVPAELASVPTTDRRIVSLADRIRALRT